MTGMSVEFMILCVMASTGMLRAQEGAQYLQNAIRDLKNMNARNNYRRVDTVQLPSVNNHRSTSNVPQLSLTKGELAALYEAAITKGDTVKLDPGEGPYIHAAVHEIDEAPSYSYEHTTTTSQDKDNLNGESTGYYYYYYPLKSFIDEMSSQSSSSSDVVQHEDYHHHHEITTTNPQPQYHSHTHQHNVHITPMKNMMDDKKSKALEPLFMAISGFIGMTVMFILSVLVLPKLHILKSRGVNKQQHGNSSDISSIARIALQAIEGKDCAERLACEMGKTARAFNLYDNRFVKLLRRMAPSSFKKHIDKVGKYTDKKHRCAAIQCKRKNGPVKKGKIGSKKP